MGWLKSMKDALGTDYEEADLQREADEEHMFTLKEDDEWERLDRFKRGEVDRRGFEVDEDTDPADLYHPSDE
jgi:hypothetical protein